MAELRSWQPGYIDRLKYGIAGLMGDDRQSVRDAEKITSLLEYAPGVGDAMAGAEAVDAFNEGNYGTAGLLGAAAAAGLVPGVGDAAAQGIKKGIRAYHGSPHDFDKFSLDKIGTGEGAQAYGHGLYFAEAEDVARQYREQLTAQAGVGGRGAITTYLRDGVELPASQKPEIEIAQTMQEFGLDPSTEEGARWLRSEISARNMSAPRDIDEQLVREIYESGPIEKNRQYGRMYEVNINANPDDFLDWDKPLSEQPENVRQAWENFVNSDAGRRYAEELGGASNMRASRYGGELKGEDIWGNFVGANEAADNYRELGRDQLLQAGIPGIKYLDAGSRGAGDGSRNYVVFDDALIEILRKYGIAGLGLLGAGGAAYNAEQDGPAPLL